MSIKKSQKILSGLNLIGNFIERPLKVGDIVLNDDGQHNLWGNIADLVPGFSLEGKLSVSNPVDVEYTSESGVSVDLSGAAAAGELTLNFGMKNSAFVSLKQVVRTTVPLGLVDAVLKQYWKEKNFDSLLNRKKYHFISEVLSAQSGTVIYSEDKDNKVKLKGKNNTPLSSLALTAEGNVEYVSTSKATLNIISATPINPLYSAVRFRGNGNFEVVG